MTSEEEVYEFKKIKEALEKTKEALEKTKENSEVLFDIDARIEQIKMVIEAIEKRIPKKPKIKHYEENGEKPYTKICCPNGCGIQLYPVTEKHMAYEHVYCPKCGQKIEWDEE